MQSSLKNITCDLTKNRMIDHSGVHCANPIIFLIKILFVRHVFSNCNVSPSSGLSLALLALSFIGFLEQNTFIAFFFFICQFNSQIGYFLYISQLFRYCHQYYIIARFTEFYFHAIHSIYPLYHA